jgi:hypothetical protein
VESFDDDDDEKKVNVVVSPLKGVRLAKEIEL